jgi:GTP cyclohydrolase I
MNFDEVIKAIFLKIGEDPERTGLLKTPKRVSKMYEEIFAGYKTNPQEILKTFDDISCEEMILVRNIRYFSTCEHHLMPFFGHADIAYIPKGKVVGLSKIARLVEAFARRLQNQENLTQQIAETLFTELKAQGVAVRLTGKHMCIMSRGVTKPEAEIITTSFLGDFKDNQDLRMEFLGGIKK